MHGLVSFDAYGKFEICDAGLLEAVAAGGILDSFPAPEGNSGCTNTICNPAGNGVCIAPTNINCPYGDSSNMICQG
jgi:hypothetical protein